MTEPAAVPAPPSREASPQLGQMLVEQNAMLRRLERFLQTISQPPDRAKGVQNGRTRS